MTKLLLAVLAAGVIATAGWAAAASLDGTDPARTVSLQSATSGETTSTTEEDVSGRCDEAEHADDPRCTGAGGEDDEDDHEDDDDRSGSNSGRG